MILTRVVEPTNARGLRRVALRLGLLLCLCWLPACNLTPAQVGVKEVGAQEVYRVISSCALEGEYLSSVSREVLETYDLQPLYDDDALEALRALHAIAVAEPRRPTLFALAELSFLIGRQRQDRDSYLAAAVYAYYYLFASEDPQAANPYDRRFRWACDLYNYGLLFAFHTPGEEYFEPEDGTRTLPAGSLRVSVDHRALVANLGQQAEGTEGIRLRFLPADRFLIRGLKLRLRDSGLGVPLIGLNPAAKPSSATLLQVGSKEMPVSAFLRLNGPLSDLGDGIGASLELHSAFDAASIPVGTARVPLEIDRSATLAHVLNQPEMWNFSLRGFFSSEKVASANKLMFVQPYARGRIPVIFVHGTASSPSYWADMFNSLWGDPQLREGFQFWFFRYTTGNPIAYSAADLRDALSEAVKTLDPGGLDPALSRMVVIGHSQGGLLAKMMAIEGNTDWVKSALGESLEDLDLPPSEFALVERALSFKPVPTVKRVVFLSTPHRGSFLANKWYSRIMASLISLPSNIASLGSNLQANAQKMPEQFRGAKLTSLTNMSAGNPYLQVLLESPIRPGVVSHSIIAIGDSDPNDAEQLAAADDGVVEYSSAHIEGVKTEFLVRSPHSCQSNPATILEVRRILREHLDASGDLRAP